MRKFKTGNIVRLKSGSPKMSVYAYLSDDQSDKRLTCQWFDNNEMKSGTFLEGQLELV